MNKKERVYAAIDFKTVDRIPTIYRGLPFLTEKLMIFFGIRDYKNFEKNYKILLEKIGADFFATGDNISAFASFHPKCNAPKPEPPYELDSAYWYALGINSKRGSSIEKYDSTFYGIGVDPPLSDIESVSDLKKDFLLSKLKYFDFTQIINKRVLQKGSIQVSKVIKDIELLEYERFEGSPDDFITMGTLNQPFIMCCYLMGMEKFLESLAFNKKLAEKLIKEVGDFCIEFNRKELTGFGEKVEWYYMWDDVASQQGLMFDSKIFREFFLPIYKKLIEAAKKYDLIFSWHCCGNVNDVLSDMIDAGIDVFDVVQTSAKDMELEKVYKRYGKSVCLHGAVDVQKLLINGDPKTIKEEVKKVIELWGNNGGIILGPSHEAMPETPVENILAIYEQIRG